MHTKSTDELSWLWIQRSLSPKFGLAERIAESKRKTNLHFLADLWSQSESLQKVK